MFRLIYSTFIHYCKSSWNLKITGWDKIEKRRQPLNLSVFFSGEKGWRGNTKPCKCFFLPFAIICPDARPAYPAEDFYCLMPWDNTGLLFFFFLMIFLPMHTPCFKKYFLKKWKSKLSCFRRFGKYTRMWRRKTSLSWHPGTTIIIWYVFSPPYPHV